MIPDSAAFTELIPTIRFLSDPGLKEVRFPFNTRDSTAPAVARLISATPPRAIKKLIGLGLVLLANSAVEIASNPTC
jgi:hypothetical protein